MRMNEGLITAAERLEISFLKCLILKKLIIIAFKRGFQ
jgi:hypothetical protein